MQPEIIVLKGAPGIGKTSLRKPLQRIFPKGVFIEVDALREMYFNLNWYDDLSHTTMIKACGYFADMILREGANSPVFVADTFSKGKIEVFVNAITRPYVILSLYCAKEKLIERLESRPPAYFRDIDACLTINEEAKKKRFPNEFFVDTTNLTPEILAQKIWKIITSGSCDSQPTAR